MTSEQAKQIEEIVKETETPQNEEQTPETKKSLLEKSTLLKKRIAEIIAIEEKLYGKMAKTRKAVAAVVGGVSGAFTGYEFMEMYNLFYDASLYGLYAQNTAGLNQMEINLLKQGVDPSQIHLPVFIEEVKEQLTDYGIDATASTSQVILDAMSKGVFDFSTLNPSTGVLVATLVGLSAAFAGFETNNFIKNRIREREQIKIAKGEDPTFIQVEEEKKAKQKEDEELKL